jgi:uncharacterized membrane protein
MTHTGQRVSFVALFVTIFIWGFAYVVTKSGLSTVPPMLFALLRYAVASVLLVPLALARGGLSRLPDPVPWKTLLLMSLTGVTIYYILFNLALAYTTASQTALIQSSFPAIIAVMALLWLHERLVIAVEASSVTARNLNASGEARLAVGPTRDVVMIDAVVERAVDVAADDELAAAYVTQADWDPRNDTGYIFFVLRPVTVQAWRESNELAGRVLMRDGTWLG